MDRLLAMKVFARVVETNGFTRAAESLQLPKATVTTLIQGLEALLGAKLLNRTTRHVSVTSDGAAYYERCVQLLSEIEEAEQSVGKNRRQPTGRLRVEVAASLGRLIIAPALTEFFARYPDIRIELGCTDRVVDLVEEGVDCAVRAGELTHPNLVARRIGEFHLVTCATPEYLSRHGMPREPRDLQQHKCIRYFSGSPGKAYEFGFSNARESFSIPVESPVVSNDGDTYMAIGLSGLGIVQVPHFMAREAISAGRLVVLLPEWRSETIPIHAVYPQNRHLSAKVRVFVDWVTELFAGVDMG